MTTSPRLLVGCALLLACSSSALPHGNGDNSDTVDEGGSGGGSTGGSGGAKVTGGSGGSVSVSGGSGGTVTSGGSGGGGSGGGQGGSGGSNSSSSIPDAGPLATNPDAMSTGTDGGSAPAPTGGAPYGCTGCRRLFDGKTLDGWVTVPGAWVVKDGALASTGKEADIFTKEDVGDARIFFQVRQIKGNHKPCTTLFGNRPDGNKGARGLGGAQFQPPNGASWNYGVGGTFTRPVNPDFNVANWHQCEIVIKEAGSFRAACCPVAATPCKGVEVLKWTGKGKKFPFNIMMHNGELFDEYRDIWIEPNPTFDGFLSQK